MNLSTIALPMSALLVNVTSLHFKCDRFIPAKHPSHLGKLLCSESNLLPRLRSIYISAGDGTEDLVRIADFIPFFYHPGLEQVSIYVGVLLDTHPSYKLDESEHLHPNSLCISKLNLLGCFLDETSARMLIEACSSLRSLIYSQWDNHSYSRHERLGENLNEASEPERRLYRHPVLDPHAFSLTLDSCKDSLENLQLTFEDLGLGGMHETLKVEGLRNFSRLTSLSIQDCHLRSFSDLPPTLNELAVEVYAMFRLPLDLDEFFGISGSGHTICPSLERVRFQSSISTGYSTITAWWEERAEFSLAIAQGSWTHLGPYGKPCCFEMRVGDVQFILRDRVLHRERHLDWNFLLDD
jgi:hypothetical protein